METRDGEAWIARSGAARSSGQRGPSRADLGGDPDADRGTHFPYSQVTPVRFAPEVPDELAEAVLWYEARNQGLGSELLDEVQATLPLIGTRPRSFPRLQDVDATLQSR